ncbi:hypothetical protein V2J09_016818 [Rumex salicifolius]
MNAISSNSGGVFFLYGYSGTGKTFIWRALSTCIRFKGEIVLTVASSGNATLLIPGGRTAHSSIGDGTIGDDNNGEAPIEIPDELLVKHHDLDPVPAIVKYIYPSILDNHVDPKYIEEWAVLAPTHEEVDKLNDYILSLLPGDEKVYLSSDSRCNADKRADNDKSIYTADYLNTIRCFGVPNHVLKLKIGVPIMLLRNIDQSLGLCNGTRLITTQLGSHVIQGRIISGNNIGHSVLIPRMSMTPSNTSYPFKFQRRQFPLSLCFAMTINKSQGQSLANVGLYLPRPVFCHGQFYVASSRVTSKKGLKILIYDKQNKRSKTTTNVVYKEVFNNM